MLLFNKILGFRDFSKLEEIKQFISSNYTLDTDEDIINSQELMIFETSRQKTWLIATNKKLFCVLDDVEKDTFEVRWYLTKDNIVKDDSVNLEINVNNTDKKYTGLIDFGSNHKDWLYSKKLFSTKEQIKEKVVELIMHKMLTN